MRNKLIIIIKIKKFLKMKKTQFNTGHWTKEEHKKFIHGILTYGNEWKKIENLVKTRNSTQARSHAQKFFSKIKKDITEYFNKDLMKVIDNNPSFTNFYEFLGKDNKKEYQFENNLTQQQKEKLWAIISKILNEENSLNNKNEKTDKKKIFTFDKDYTIRELKRKKYSNDLNYFTKKNPFNICFLDINQNNEQLNDSS